MPLTSERWDGRSSAGSCEMPMLRVRTGTGALKWCCHHPLSLWGQPACSTRRYRAGKGAEMKTKHIPRSGTSRPPPRCRSFAIRTWGGRAERGCPLAPHPRSTAHATRRCCCQGTEPTSGQSKRDGDSSSPFSHSRLHSPVANGNTPSCVSAQQPPPGIPRTHPTPVSLPALFR